MTGEILSYAIYEDGTRELIEHGYNLVVSSASIALAQAAKEGSSIFAYWALGDGDGSSTAEWDAGIGDGSIAPDPADVQLDNEIFRKQITDIEYIDANDNVVAGPTNRIQITVLFLEDEPVSGGSAFLREFGIFGGTDASGAAGSGLMINRRCHITYEKTEFSQLERILRFTF